MGCTLFNKKCTKLFLFCILIILILFQVKADIPHEQDVSIKGLGYEVKKVIKKLNPVYTQGLIYEEESGERYLYESGGLYGSSTFTKMKFPSLEQVQKISLEKKYFGEGIARNKDKFYQLTWNERQVLVYTKNENNQLFLQSILPIPWQLRSGWGLCSFGNDEFLATDGTNKIHFIRVEPSFEVYKTLEVYEVTSPLHMLNEIKVIDNRRALINVYLTSKIVLVDLETGLVLKNYDFNAMILYEIKNGLDVQKINQGNVLNGIAIMDKYTNSNNGSSRRVLLTGKSWHFYYETILDLEQK